MKRSFIFLFSTLISFALFAAPRSEQQAREIAVNHFAQKGSAKVRSKVLSSQPELSLVATGTELLARGNRVKGMNDSCVTDPFYIYNLGADAFVIVSGDDIAEPVLAYSNVGAFHTEGLPEHILSWLNTYAEEMAYAASHADDRVIANAPAKASAYPREMAPIMKYDGTLIQWDQNSPFNDQCPNYRGARSVAGCVATALAQIMYYHRYPEKGIGSKLYITETYNISQEYNFADATYNYDDMLPHYYYHEYTEEQGAAAADFTHAIGVAVEMDYAPEGSGAKSLDVGPALVKYFGYDKNIHYAMRDYFTLEEWQEMLKKEICEGRPVCYAGTSTSIGHQFVFEGYDSNNYFYINWGWAGMSDGYFRLSALSPSSLGTGGGSATNGGFIYNQAMWLGMQAPSEDTTPVSFFITHNSNLTSDKTQALPGEMLSLTILNYYNASVDFSGQMGVVLEDNDGVQTVLSSQAINVKCGYGKEGSTGTPAVNTQFSLPSALADGTYYLYMATKAEGELQWSRLRANAGYNDRYLVTVDGGMATLASMVTEPKGEGTIEAAHAIYTNITAEFTANVTNVGLSEYFGIGRVAVYTETESGPQIAGYCGMYQLSLPPGKSTNVVFKGPIEAPAGSSLKTGNYKACLVVEHQGKYYQMTDAIDITVKRPPTGMATLTISNLQTSPTEVAKDGVLAGKFTVSTNRAVFAGPIGIIVFKKGSNTGTCVWEDDIFLEPNGSANVRYAASLQLEPGEYKASIRYNQNFTNEITSYDFMVLDISDSVSGVDDALDVNGTQYFSLSGVQLSEKPARGMYIMRQKTQGGVRTLKVSSN